MPLHLLLPALALCATMAPVCAGNPPDALRRGIELSRKKYPEEAVAEFKKCTDWNALSINDLKTMIQTYFDGGDPDTCQKMISYALSQERIKKDAATAAWMIDLRATIYSDQGKQSEAVASFKQAAQTDKTRATDYLPKAGKILIKMKQYREAIPFLETGIKAHLMNADLYQDEGNCYLQLHEPAHAIDPLTRAIQAYVNYRTKNKTEAFLPGLIQCHKYLIQAYKETNNTQQVAVWQARYNRLVGDLDNDFFGK